MVNLIASYIVKPAKPVPTKVMYLSECDQCKPLTHASTVHFYKPKSPELLKDSTDVLKDSLSEALLEFYPLAGRLYQKDGGGGRVELHCNSMGALLLEAQSELKIEDFGDFCPTPQIRALIPPIDYNNTPLHEVPLLLVQITKFVCGGVSLGLAVSHVIVDGQSGCHFVSEWAKIARGEKYDDQPFLDRTILQQYEEYSSSTAPKLHYSDFYPLPVLIGQSSSLEERKKATTCAMLQLSEKQIEQLQNKANYQDLIHKTSNQRPFSRFVAVSAYTWKCLSKARMHSPDQETVLYVTVDFRNRLKLPLARRYFGNAVLPVPARAIAGDLQSRSLSYASSKIKEAIENVTDEYVRSYLVCMKNLPEVSNSRHFHTVGCAQGLFFGNPNLLITSWVGLDVYKANFGWGDAISMTPGSLGYDGRLFLIPSPTGDGSLIIPLRLQVEHINAFKKYFYEDI